MTAPAESAPPTPPTTAALVGRAAGWTMAARLVRFASGVALSIVVVRGLGAADYGRLAIVRTALGFVTVVCYAGLGQAMLRFLPELRARGDRRGARRLVRAALVAQAVVWLAAALVVVPLAPAADRAMHAAVGALLVLGTALLVADLAVTALQQSLTAWYALRLYSIGSAAAGVLLVGGTWAALHQGYGVAGVLVASALANAALAGVLAVQVARLLAAPAPSGEEPAAPGPPASGVSLRRLVRYALPFAAIGVLNLITWRQSETLLLGHFRGPREAGWFDLAYRVPQQLLEFVPATLWPLVMASFSEAYTRDPAALRRVIRAYYTFLFALAVPVAAGGAVLAPAAVPLLFGSDMQPAAPLASLFFLVFSVSFLGTPLSMALYVLERTPLVLAVYGVQAVVNVGLDLALIPRYGLYGALLPVALVVTLSPLVYFHLVTRIAGRPAVPWGFLARAAASSLGWLALLPLVPQVTTLPRLGAAILAGLALTVVGARLTGLVREEEAALLMRTRLPGVRAALGLLGARPREDAA